MKARQAIVDAEPVDNDIDEHPDARDYPMVTKKMAGTLSAIEREFVRQMFIQPNATKALLAAGYSNDGYKGKGRSNGAASIKVRIKASRLVRDPKIIEAVHAYNEMLDVYIQTQLPAMWEAGLNHAMSGNAAYAKLLAERFDRRFVENTRGTQVKTATPKKVNVRFVSRGDAAIEMEVS